MKEREKGNVHERERGNIHWREEKERGGDRQYNVSERKKSMTQR